MGPTEIPQKSFTTEWFHFHFTTLTHHVCMRDATQCRQNTLLEFYNTCMKRVCILGPMGFEDNGVEPKAILILSPRLKSLLPAKL